tara:strand:- start:90 stop:3146 length:3057 start_codon:yes stop_codon:yes gene_type:complete
MTDIDTFQQNRKLCVFELDESLEPVVRGWKKLTRPGFHPNDGECDATYGIRCDGFMCVVVGDNRANAVVDSYGLQTECHYTQNKKGFYLFRKEDIERKQVICDYGDKRVEVDITITDGVIPIPTEKNEFGNVVVHPEFVLFFDDGQKRLLPRDWNLVLCGVHMFKSTKKGYDVVKYHNPQETNLNIKGRRLPTKECERSLHAGMPWNHGKGSLDYTLNQAIQSKHSMVLARERAGHYYVYASCASRMTLASKIYKGHSEGEVMNYHEVLAGNSKFVADLDWTSQQPVSEVLAAFTALFKFLYEWVVGKTFNASHARYSTATLDITKKGSLHFSYYDPGVGGFAEYCKQYPFWKCAQLVLDERKPEHATLWDTNTGKSVIDMGVWTSKHNMRMIFSSKHGEAERTFKPCTDKGDLIILENEGKVVEYMMGLDTMDATITLNLPVLHLACQFVEDNASYAETDDEKVTQIIDALVPDATVSAVQGNMFIMQNTGVRICPINGEANETDNCYVIRKKGSLMLGCHDEGCRGQMKCIHRFTPLIMQSMNLRKLKILGAKVTNEKDLATFERIVVEYLNTYFTLIIGCSKPYIYQTFHEFNPVTKKHDYVANTLSKDGLALNLMNKNIVTGVKDEKGRGYVIDTFKLWMTHERRAEKDRVEFVPETDKNPHHIKDNVYNLWSGRGLSDADIESAEPLPLNHAWFRHLKTRVCGGDERLFLNDMCWFSQTLFKPWKKLYHSIVLIGQPGAGKGLVVQPIMDIMGERHAWQPSSAQEILGDFNKEVMGKKIIFIDEMVWGGDKQRAGDLKKLITENKASINEKYMSTLTVRNLANLIFSSNENHVVPAGSKARRYAVHACSGELAGITHTQAQKQEIMEIANVPRDRLARTLRDWDCSKFNDREPPGTQALFDQQLKTIPDYEKWWFRCLDTGAINVEKGLMFGGKMTKEDVYEEYKEKTESRHPLGTSRELFSYLTSLTKTNMSKTTVIKERGTTRRVVQLPDLVEARNGFGEHMGSVIKWDSD